MDKNMEWLNIKKIERTIKALNTNNINGYFAKNKEELISIIDKIVPKGLKVACGGSMTLEECGVLDYIRDGRYNFLDRFKDGITMKEKKAIYREAFTADAFFVSSNAVTQQGEIYNVDGTGNRVAAMIYGPDKVIVICGVNKIVLDLDEAIERVKNIAAPANAKRLNMQTPCAKTGKCMDCSSKQRICNEYTVINGQWDPDRIHVIFLNEVLGY